MADDNHGSESKVGDSEVEEEGSSEGRQGETLSFSAAESDKTLRSDFCSAEEYKGEEEFGEGEWVCEQIERRGEYYGEVVPERGELLGEEEEEEEEDLSLEDRKSLDSEYLKAVLGTPLTYALLDISSKRPTDPIQYLGHYLIKWRWCEKNKVEYEKKVAELTKERTDYIERIKEKERQEMLMKEQQEEDLRRKEKVESSIEEYGESQRFVEE